MFVFPLNEIMLAMESWLIVKQRDREISCSFVTKLIGEERCNEIGMLPYC